MREEDADDQGSRFARAATTGAAAAATATAPGADRAAEILCTLEREPGDRLTCKRVFGDFYRCNWWATGTGSSDAHMIRGLEVSTYRVRKSRMVRATVAEGQLIVEDATPDAG